MPVQAPLLKLDTIPESGNRFKLGKHLSSGVFASVFEAEDLSSNNKKVAIKIQKLLADTQSWIEEEYKILKNFCNHPNLPEFYGIFKNKNKNGIVEIWFAMELCEGGSIMDIVRNFYNKNRRMAEEHIAFVIKEVTKALVHLHSNKIIHRSVSGDNILLTRDGEVKLVDFSLCRELSNSLGKQSTFIGAAYWMAPEVVLSGNGHEEYDKRADVWALGITAIELGDGKAPLAGMHPTRVMFQVVRNPPPGLYRPGNWSEQYNDFISECLEKNPEYRPFMEELLDHPFLTSVPENCHYLSQELKKIFEECEETFPKQPEWIIKNNMLITNQDSLPQKLFVEDLAALENIKEDNVIDELKGRFDLGYFHTFIGDILLIINPNTEQDLYNNDYHKKYSLKSRSSNPPHVYSIADRAYQDAMHQEAPQHIILSGESGSGKTTCLKHLVKHLLYLGNQFKVNKIAELVEKALETILEFVSAKTEVNCSSTRSIINFRIGYGGSGKVSTGKIEVQQLEKCRISFTDMSQSNFHILYYFYDFMKYSGQLNVYLLDPDVNYRYLRVSPNETNKTTSIRYESIIENLKSFSITEEQLITINKILAAILNLGEIRFNETGEHVAEIENPEICVKIAELLEIEEKKFKWALLNYCVVEQGIASRRKNNCDQARETRDMLANNLYARLVDWIVNYMNVKMSSKRTIYGEKYSVHILDYFGFECFKRNDLEQFLINTFNEQMQYLYIQRVFGWEILEQREEGIPPLSLNYYDNKKGIDRLLGKPTGVLALIEEASKTGHGFQHVLESLKRLNKSTYINTTGSKEFYFCHYPGKIIYDIREMLQKNRDFLPPEMIEVLRLSSNSIIRELFINNLNKTGNLVCDLLKETNKWSSALAAKDKQTKLPPEKQYSQTKHMRSTITIFRSICLEILRTLSIGAGSGGTHFIRCVRSDLTKKPNNFNRELIKQQLRSLSVFDTMRARQLGFPHRISFAEFLRRYKFLAFDFDENVDVSKDNCRLLLVRLKMEGWVIGKNKVFLKYYNEEYLSRLYETQVKKIIKIQAMMRAFLAKRNVTNKIKSQKNKTEKKLVRQQTKDLSSEAAAALLIQKAYRGYNVRKKYGPLINKESGQIDSETANFLKPFARKWRKKSLFQILLQYRSAKFHDLINLSQQIHIFNQTVIHQLQKIKTDMDLDKIDSSARSDSWLGPKKPSVWKLPFHFEDIPYYNTDHMCDSNAIPIEEEEKWDSPFQWRESIIQEKGEKDIRSPTPTLQLINTNEELLLNTTFNRDPTAKIDSIKKVQSPITQIISPKKTPVSNTDKNSEGANQDFEFIPSKNISKLKRRPGNPIAELETIGKKVNSEKLNEDDPPFNFQGMLRKTNFQRKSLRRIPEELPYNKVLKNKINKIINTEIAPGIILEGIETEL